MELHARQFIAGPHHAARENLHEHDSFGSLHISFHSKLDLVRTEIDDCEFVALGHLIDPSRPRARNEDVVRNLDACRSFDDVENVIAGIGGRWLLFARIGGDARLYPDAGGSKSVFYKDGWVASQPGLFGFPVDDGLSQFPTACTWPMGETPFPGVRQLLPNHYLDLRTFGAIRFGPRAPQALNVDDAVTAISDILRGTLEALDHRGTVALPLTGGRDSRTLLSAGVEMKSRLKLFTIVDEETPRHDYVIPRILSKVIGEPIHFIKTPPHEDMRVNTAGLWQDRFQRRLPAFAQADFVVLGHMSEICRCCYWTDGVPKKATPELLSKIAGFGGERLDAFANWLAGVPTDSKVDPLDLFYWESRVGIWSSLCCTVLDGYCEVISPYNCRTLIEAGLGVDVAYRRRSWEMHKRLCRPDMRFVPFNETRLDGVDEYLAARIPRRVQMLIKRLDYSMTSFVADGT
ncbi:MAG TPA: hypothetical protein VHB46_10835 [Burkholderiales bacterium]|nr:hypothetical protein [Burkholderiales bacterium]